MDAGNAGRSGDDINHAQWPEETMAASAMGEDDAPIAADDLGAKLPPVKTTRADRGVSVESGAGVSRATDSAGPESSKRRKVGEGEQLPGGTPRENGQLEVQVAGGAAKGNSAAEEKKTSKEKERLASHVATEQRRRDRINERFAMLRELVPQRRGPTHNKSDKATFLLEVIEYIKMLHTTLQNVGGGGGGLVTMPGGLVPAGIDRKGAAVLPPGMMAAAAIPGVGYPPGYSGYLPTTSGLLGMPSALSLGLAQQGSAAAPLSLSVPARAAPASIAIAGRSPGSGSGGGGADSGSARDEDQGVSGIPFTPTPVDSPRTSLAYHLSRGLGSASPSNSPATVFSPLAQSVISHHSSAPDLTQSVSGLHPMDAASISQMNHMMQLQMQQRMHVQQQLQHLHSAAAASAAAQAASLGGSDLHTS